MCVLAFNRLIALYLLLLHALVFTNTCAELDKLMYVDNAGATLSMVVLGIRPLIHLYFRLKPVPKGLDLRLPVTHRNKDGPREDSEHRPRMGAGAMTSQVDSHASTSA